MGQPHVDQTNEVDLMESLPLATCNNSSNTNGEGKAEEENQLNDLVALLGESMPHDPSAPHYSYLSNFMSLRLMLLKPSPTKGEMDQRETLLSSFASYLASGRSKIDIAVMIARDYMFLKQQSQPKPSPRLQAAPVPTNSHSNFQPMEQFNLPIQNNALSASNMNHIIQFLPNPGQGSAVQNQFNALVNNTHQHLRTNNNQQVESMDSSNHNGIILQRSSNTAGMSLESLTNNDVNKNPNSSKAQNDVKSE